MLSLALAVAQPATDYGPYWPFARVSEINRSNTGVTVSPAKALQIAAVAACVQRISFGLGSLRCWPYQTSAKSKRVYDKADIYPLLSRGPNPRMTFMSWMVKVLHDVLIVAGNSYSIIERANDGSILAIWPQTPSRVKMYVTEGGDFAYEIQYDNGPPKYYRYEDILHIRNIGCDGYIGYTPISIHREVFGSAIALQDFNGSLYRNGVRPTGVFTHPQKMKPEPFQRLKEQVNEHAGTNNSGKALILEEGMTWHPLGMNMHDAQFIDQQKLSRRDIAAIFNVPAKMVGDTEAESYGSAEADARWFVDQTLRPWAEWIEQEMEARFFADEPDACIRFDFSGLLRGDMKTRSEALQIMRRNGVINANQWLESEDMNPIEGGAGDVYLVEANMTRLDMVGEEPEPEPGADPGDEDTDTPPSAPADDVNVSGESVRCAHRRVFVDILDRMAKIESTSRARAEKAGAGACAKATHDHYILLVSALGPAADAYAVSVAVLHRKAFDETAIHQATRAAAHVAMNGQPAAEACVDDVMRTIAEAVG